MASVGFSRGQQGLNSAKTPILIDSFPGQSGNFIAYAINLCIFDVNPGKDIFTDLGTIQVLKFDDDHIKHMQCFAAHWSDQDLEISLPKKCTVIRVITDNHVSQLISVINLILRAGDRSFESVGAISSDELIRTLWHKFVNFSMPKWKQHDDRSQYLDFAVLWNKQQFQQWMLGLSRYFGQGTRLHNLDLFDEVHDYYWQKNHGMNIWKESRTLLDKYVNDTEIRHFVSPFHDFAVFYRIISYLQLFMPPDHVGGLINDCIDSGLDFQIARQTYGKYNVL